MIRQEFSAELNYTNNLDNVSHCNVTIGSERDFRFFLLYSKELP